jgi:predicted Zn-dependent protease
MKTKAALLFAVSLAACDVPQEQEAAMGAEAAEQIGSQLPLVRDPYINAYINELGDTIAKRTSRADLDWQFAVVNSHQINAFALPGGFIYVNRGLVERAENLSELAGVLGHEIGHVLGRHSAERLAKQQLTQNLIGAVVVGSGGGYDTAQIAQMVGSLINMKYGREDELESDSLGLRLMREAGYDPKAMIGVMQALEKASGGGRQPEFASTHPNPGNRIQKIREELQKMGL